MVTGHSHGCVDLLRFFVGSVYVQAQAFQFIGLLYRFTEMIIDCSEGTLAARIGCHVDRMDPDNRSVAPVTPLGYRHRHTLREPRLFNDPVSGSCLSIEDGGNSLGQCFMIERQSFAFLSHMELKVDDGWNFEGLSKAYRAHVDMIRYRVAGGAVSRG